MTHATLFIQCIVDGMYPEVGEAMVTLFQRLGITMDYPENQTCCGQPSFNSGYRKKAAKAAKHYIETFENSETIVYPSGSCVTMVRHHYPELFENEPTWKQRTIADLVNNTEPEWGTKKSVIQWDHPMVNALDLKTALKAQDVPVYTAAFDSTGMDDIKRSRAKDRVRQQMIDSYIGVTSADFCLADTATLIMKSRPKEARAVSLLPAIHVAVIRKEQILTNLKELYALLKYDPDTREPEMLPHHMTLISGPSKTADIELVMVHGARSQGPLSLCNH